MGQPWEFHYSTCMAKTENNKVQTAEITSELEKLVNNWISYLDEMGFDEFLNAMIQFHMN